MTAAAHTQATRTRMLALGAWAVLAGCIVLALLQSTRGPAALVLGAVLLLPLFAPLSGLVRGTRRSYAWATLCLTPALIFGLVEAIANPAARVHAALVLFASLLGFVALIAHLRVTREVVGRLDT